MLRNFEARDQALADALALSLEEAEDDAMGKRTKPPSSRLELAWQSVMSEVMPDAFTGGSDGPATCTASTSTSRCSACGTWSSAARRPSSSPR